IPAEQRIRAAQHLDVVEFGEIGCQQYPAQQIFAERSQAPAAIQRVAVDLEAARIEIHELRVLLHGGETRGFDQRIVQREGVLQTHLLVRNDRERLRNL